MPSQHPGLFCLIVHPDLLFLILTIFVGSLPQANAGSMRRVQDDVMKPVKQALSDPKAVLGSPACAEFGKKKGKKMEKALAHTDEEIISAFCNPVEIEKLEEHNQEMEEEVAKAEVGQHTPGCDGFVDPCQLAYAEVLLEGKSDKDAAFGTVEGCKAELGKELTENKEHMRRMLAGRRELDWYEDWGYEDWEWWNCGGWLSSTICGWF